MRRLIAALAVASLSLVGVACSGDADIPLEGETVPGEPQRGERTTPTP